MPERLLCTSSLELSGEKLPPPTLSLSIICSMVYDFRVSATVGSLGSCLQERARASAAGIRIRFMRMGFFSYCSYDD